LLIQNNQFHINPRKKVLLSSNLKCHLLILLPIRFWFISSKQFTMLGLIKYLLWNNKFSKTKTRMLLLHHLNTKQKQVLMKISITRKNFSHFQENTMNDW
jgi:hypothetical protein